MAGLDAEIQRLLQASLAEGTHLVYQRGIKNFENFRGRCGFPKTWPAPCNQVVSFIAALSLERKAPSTIKSYVAGIAFQHKINGWYDPTKPFVVQKLLEGCKRSDGKEDSRAPITINMLPNIMQVLDKVCSSTYETALFRAAFSLAFFAFLRVGEFTMKTMSDKGDRVIAVSDIRFEGPGVKALYLRLRYSKTDQAGRSTVIKLNRCIYSQICPVQALMCYMSNRPEANAPLFIHMDKKPLTRFQFQSVLNKTLACCGIATAEFKTHSFRIGAATTAAMCGVSSDDIKRLGRWKSSAYTRYIRPQFTGQFS